MNNQVLPASLKRNHGQYYIDSNFHGSWLTRIKAQVNDTSRPILAAVSWLPWSLLLMRNIELQNKQTRPTEDLVNTNSSNDADTQLSAVHSSAQNAVQSSAGQLISPPPSRPATPELPPVPPPSPTFETRTAFLSRPCIPDYSLYRAAPASNGGNRNGQGDKVGSIRCPVSNISHSLRTLT